MENLSENRRARFDYEILDTFEAGIELLGIEVKSSKLGHMQLTGSYAHIRDGELWLINATIPPYQPNNTAPDYNQTRSRRLLLQKDEIKGVLGKLKEKTALLIPLRAYIKHNLIKLELGLARPKKKHDKREAIKKRGMLR